MSFFAAHGYINWRTVYYLITNIYNIITFFSPGFFFILVQGIEVWPGLACGQSSDFPLTSGLLDTAWQDHLVPEFHGGSIQRRSNHNMVRPRLGHVT